jgi:hypothetical protein
LIALIINTRDRYQSSGFRYQTDMRSDLIPDFLIPDFWILILKDQLASDRSDGVRSSSRQMHGRSAIEPWRPLLGDCASIAACAWRIA